MDLTPAAKLVLMVLLGPLAAVYDFCTSPTAPPAIFVAQWNGSFPNHPIEPAAPRPVHKHVTVTRPL
jgi:hypothetical protein